MTNQERAEKMFQDLYGTPNEPLSQREMYVIVFHLDEAVREAVAERDKWWAGQALFSRQEGFASAREMEYKKAYDEGYRWGEEETKRIIAESYQRNSEARVRPPTSEEGK